MLPFELFAAFVHFVIHLVAHRVVTSFCVLSVRARQQTGLRVSQGSFVLRGETVAAMGLYHLLALWRLVTSTPVIESAPPTRESHVGISPSQIHAIRMAKTGFR